MADNSNTLKLRLVLDVQYDLNGEDPVGLANYLHRLVQRAVGDGLLTGSSEATVDTYSHSVVELPEPLSEEVLAAFMDQRIADSQIAVEDLGLRMARYGLMEPPAFVAEMRERMDNATELEV